ncbi:hypothetical protein, partial [Tepidimonas ignava]|uniref:hypothetical protein n=1 Tax=Tepidimonas ignava TaxID=114249 RepID=UPI001A9D0BA7
SSGCGQPRLASPTRRCCGCGRRENEFFRDDYLEVSRDGKTLTVDKNACKAVCLDKEIHGTSYGNNQLVLSLQ